MPLHTPNDHQNHGPNEPCGCWTATACPEDEAIACPKCGAAYQRAAVLQIGRWHCYDCEELVYAEKIVQRARDYDEMDEGSE
jgi:hypothetical protein